LGVQLAGACAQHSPAPSIKTNIKKISVDFMSSPFVEERATPTRGAYTHLPGRIANAGLV
jgi:hypothetical protein